MVLYLGAEPYPTGQLIFRLTGLMLPGKGWQTPRPDGVGERGKSTAPFRTARAFLGGEKAETHFKKRGRTSFRQ